MHPVSGLCPSIHMCAVVAVDVVVYVRQQAHACCGGSSHSDSIVVVAALSRVQPVPAPLWCSTARCWGGGVQGELRAGARAVAGRSDEGHKALCPSSIYQEFP